MIIVKLNSYCVQVKIILMLAKNFYDYVYRFFPYIVSHQRLFTKSGLDWNLCKLTAFNQIMCYMKMFCNFEMFNEFLYLNKDWHDHICTFVIIVKISLKVS